VLANGGWDLIRRLKGYIGLLDEISVWNNCATYTTLDGASNATARIGLRIRTYDERFKVMSAVLVESFCSSLNCYRVDWFTTLWVISCFRRDVDGDITRCVTIQKSTVLN
jgi:hypothetical protein